MSPRSRLFSVSALVAAALAAGLAIAPTVSAQQLEPADACGAYKHDYVGGATLDTPFNGTITLPGGGTYGMTIYPTTANHEWVHVQVTASPTDIKVAKGDFTLQSNSLGRGSISFPSPKSHWHKGFSTDVHCASGPRVTKITGKIPVEGFFEELDFNVSRN